MTLFVESETIPEVNPLDDVMIIERDHGSEAAPARVYLVALEPDTDFTVFSAASNDFAGTAFTLSDTLASVGEPFSVSLPVGGAPPTHQVTIVRINRGRAVLSVCAPHQIKAEFRPRNFSR